MAVSSAKPAFGSHIQVSDMGGTPVFTSVAEVKNITGPAMKRAVLDASNQDSPNQHKEIKAGFGEGGTVTFEFNWYPGDTLGQGRLLTVFQAGTLNNFKIVGVEATPKTWAFSGIMTAFEPEYPVAGLMGGKCTIEISGMPVLS
jgi:hypothetical protein